MLVSGQIGGRDVASGTPVKFVLKAAVGPYAVPTLKGGDPGTYKDGAYLKARLDILITCSGFGVVQMGDFSLHIA
jgi:hypothetical protein